MESPEPHSTAESSAGVNAGNSTHRTQQVIEVIQPIIEKVQGIVGKVKGMAWIYLAAAFVLAGILFLPFSGPNVLMYAFAAAILLLLAVPSGILFLFHMGLQTVLALPSRLLEKAGVGEASARNILQAVKSTALDKQEIKKKKVLGTLTDMRKLVLDSKDMLIEYTALLRLANPFVLGIVAAATVAGAGIVVAALIAVIILIL
ncbi:MAG: hypothetical protein AB8G77_03150 [Rhodothermales bacterium]